MHRTLTAAMIAVALTSTLARPTVAQDAPANAGTTKPAPAVPWEPSPKYTKEGTVHQGFIDQHEQFLKRGKKPVGLLLLGDSITAGWGGKAKDVYERAFGAYQPANFGISGDGTQHVLWRIANGELDNIRPKVVMLMIGTNNSSKKADEISRGVIAVVDAIKAKLPETKILLLGVFPRGANPADAKTASLRQKYAEVNATLAALDDGGKTVRYLDIGRKFLDDKGVITKEIMPDALHLSVAGYKIWADAVKPTIAEMMQ